MELRECMYIKTKLNDFCNTVAIRKIEEIDEDDDNKFWIDDYIIDTFGDEQNKLSEEDVDKASFDITDLITKGDYVNGHLVLDVFWNVEEDHVILIEDSMNNSTSVLYNEDIKSVVTKEMFYLVKYEVE